MVGTITHDFDDGGIVRVKSKKMKKKEEPSDTDREITKYLELHFGESCTYNWRDGAVYIYDNSIIGSSKYVEFLKNYRVVTQPSLL